MEYRLSECAKHAKKANHRFYKRSYIKNCEEYLKSMKIFKDTDTEAKRNYLEDLVEMMDPINPQEFWSIINNGWKCGGV